MPRVSLRLDDSLLDRSLPHGSVSFSAGEANRGSARSLRSRRSQQLSVSCTDSFLVQPPSLLSSKKSRRSFLDNSVHSVASDASLLSSLLDESSVQDVTLVDTVWGLDQDLDPKESTIIEQSSMVANSTLIGSQDHEPSHRVLHKIHCEDNQQESTTSTFKHAAAPSSSIISPATLSNLETEVLYCPEQKSRRRTAPSAASRTMKKSPTNLKEPQVNGSECNKVGHVFRWVGSQWQLTKRDSSPLHSGSLHFLTALVLLLLLLLSLVWFSPGLLHSAFETSNVPGEETPAVSSVPAPSTALSSVSSQWQHTEDAEEEPPPSQEEVKSKSQEQSSQDSSKNWVVMEQRLAAMWERVETQAQWAEQRHREVLQLYTDLQQQLTVAESRNERQELGPWISGVLDHQVTQVRRKLDQERMVEQRGAASRLYRLEQQLQTLAADTEQQLQRLHSPPSPNLGPPPSPVLDSPPPSAPSVYVEHQSHDALLAEVARLEVVLEDVKQSIEVLSESKDNCGPPETMQQTVSTQVREEVRALIYGNQLMATGGVDSDPPQESLLQWFTQRYVSSNDLQEALSSLEQSILQNISLKQQQGGVEVVNEDLTGATATVGGAATLEDVHVIVKNALRLFSQDQTGLADYALESGGGSILSTRCSESYQTKAALLSLFGIPLWYFSQSPRTVIQPDVQPGNCWAFKGSRGCLVIRLSMRILPTAFSLEHIPKALAPSGTLHSAPREFSVFGLKNASEEKGTLLGVFTYDQDGDALQTFDVAEENNQTFQIVELQVLSNWGHKDFTCVYRFRVHGTPQEGANV